MRGVILAVLVIFAAAIGLPAGAADFNEGCEAFDRGDFERAMEEWEPLAEQGHPAAQFRLGCLYAFGQGVEQDYTQALSLYQESAGQGDADAQNNLGSMYALGWGAGVDLVEAYMWLELAARSGHEMATKNRSFLAGRMTGEEVGEAVARADRFAASRATN